MNSNVFDKNLEMQVGIDLKHGKNLLLYANESSRSKEVFEEFKELCIDYGFNVVKDSPDFVVSIGGDGAMLRAIRFHKHFGVPYIGINAGSLGFLPNFSSDRQSMIDLLKLMLLEDSYEVLYRPLLDLEFGDVETNIKSNFAFNEVFIKYANMKMMEIDLFIDDVHFNSYTGDGLAISTPLGTTGYAIWAGAAVLNPSMPCYQLTPINPNNSSINNPLLHPLVLPESQNLRLEIRNESHHAVSISCDGNSLIDDTINFVKIRVSKEKIAMLESKDYDYWKIFKSKILEKKKER